MDIIVFSKLLPIWFCFDLFCPTTAQPNWTIVLQVAKLLKMIQMLIKTSDHFRYTSFLCLTESTHQKCQPYFYWSTKCEYFLHPFTGTQQTHNLQAVSNITVASNSGQHCSTLGEHLTFWIGNRQWKNSSRETHGACFTSPPWFLHPPPKPPHQHPHPVMWLRFRRVLETQAGDQSSSAWTSANYRHRVI